MERIKAAIEKAKAQGKTVVALPAPTTARALPHHARAAAPASEQLDVSYSATEVVTLDASHLERHRVVAFNKTHPSNQAFDLLRTQVLQKMDEHGWRTLAITSPTKEAGKTSVAINLAACIAHHTQRTAMLVDFDLRRPSVAKYLGLQRSTSLNEVLAGQADVQAALVNPGLPRLVVLPTNQPVARSAEVLSSPAVGELVQDLRNRYSERIVIFDLPPALAADDVLTIMPRMDCVLLVVGSGSSTQKEIEETMRHMPSTPLVGYVVNKDDAPLSRGYQYY
jgi:Mrp family chromosome partitioning ATPase